MRKQRGLEALSRSHSQELSRNQAWDPVCLNMELWADAAPSAIPWLPLAKPSAPGLDLEIPVTDLGTHYTLGQIPDLLCVLMPQAT
jgi:hypothetical protein